MINTWSLEELKWCGAYNKKHWQEETEHILRIANEVCNNEFLFDLKWDMEQTQEKISFSETIDWDRVEFSDEEFTFQMNRHRYFICLGQAYILTGDEKYTKKFLELMHSWIDANALCDSRKNTTWRTIEAGIRAESFIKAMMYFRYSSLVTESDFNVFVESMRVHADYLYENDRVFATKSNWGVIENHGLYMIASYLPELNLNKYREVAIKRLEKQLSVQVFADGVHWEQSPMYHNEVLKCVLEVIRTTRIAGSALPDSFMDIAKKMVFANITWKKPNHCQPANGDSDETDIRDIISIGAYEFMFPQWKQEGYPYLDFEAVWDYGKEAALAYENMESICSSSDIVHYELKESGNYIIKSADKRDYIHFLNGPLGGGHGHMDKLHLDISFNGVDVLIDPGRYTYVWSPLRDLLKSAKAHNVPMVDGKEYTVCNDSWSVSGLTNSVVQPVKRASNFALLEAGHLGYINDGVFVNRKVVVIGTEHVVILDEFHGKGNHKYEQLYHFSEESKVSKTDKGLIANVKDFNVEYNICTVDTKVCVEETSISKHYNQVNVGEMARVSIDKEGFGTIMTVISKCNVGKPKLIVDKVPVKSLSCGYICNDCEAEAIVITDENKKYTVAFKHVEAGGKFDYIAANGVESLGRVFVGCENTLTSEKHTIVLKV